MRRRAITPNTFAIDPDFRIGNAQNWQVSAQMDLPAALVATATYQRHQRHARGTGIPAEYLSGGRGQSLPLLPFRVYLPGVERQLDARERTVSVAPAAA